MWNIIVNGVCKRKKTWRERRKKEEVVKGRRQ